MTEQENQQMRLACLEAAIRTKAAHDTSTDMVDAAKKFHEFVSGEDAKK